MLVHIHQILINEVKNMKLLGRIFSSNFTVKKHYKNSIASTQANTNLLACLTTIKSGLYPRISSNLYNTFVRSKTEYGRTTMAHASQYINNKISTVQKSAFRRCVGLPPTTPKHVIFAIAEELMPTERAKLLTAKELIKLKIHNIQFFNELSVEFPVKSSDSFVYQKYKNILDRIVSAITIE